MMAHRSIDTLIKPFEGPPARVAVAMANDEDVLLAIRAAMAAGLIWPVLTGDREKIAVVAGHIGLDLAGIEIIHEPVPAKACSASALLVKEGRADILMKGLVNTSTLLKAVLDKEMGLLTGGLLSHVAFFESPYYGKVFCVTDAAMNIMPDLSEKASIIMNAVEVCHQLGIVLPKVAVLAALETVNPKMEATTHAALLSVMQRRNQLAGCIVDGPLALDNAISAEAARHKGIESTVAGDADILVAPDLHSGNILYKALGFLGGARTAAIIAGARVPVVLTSRADSDTSKYLSLALAASLNQKEQ